LTALRCASAIGEAYRGTKRSRIRHGSPRRD
jgi:hypothetical protein